MTLARTRPMVAALAVALVSVTGCTGGGSSPSASTAAGATASASTAADANVVEVTLVEWGVVPSIESTPSGDVTFQVTNEGPADVHEFVVLKTDLDPAELPTDEQGAVTEDGEGIEVIDEIEDIPVGETQELAVTLEAGSYVLLCNIYSEDENEAHYAEGMRIAFAVE